jgi:glycogen(starch) synthase
MLRVAHCIYDDPHNPWVGGGGAMRVFEIYRRLAGQVEATVLTGNFPGAQDEFLEGVHYHRLGASAPYPWSRWTYARAATRFLARGVYDVGVYDFSVYTPLRLPGNRPVGLVVHMLHGPTADDRWSPLLGWGVRRYERSLLRRVSWISTTSLWMEAQLRLLIRPEIRIHVIGSGVPDEFTRVQRREENYLLSYGRFDLFQKGLDTLLQAFARVAPAFPGVDLRIAGRGKDETRVRELVREMGLQDRVQVLPGVKEEEVLALFAGALALVMPSRLEGLPMVPAEAMAAGVPVIATQVGAVHEVVDPPAGGILIPPDDSGALASAMRTLMEDPARREALSRSARRSAERFSWDAVAERHLDFLRAVAADRGGTGAFL